MLLGRPLPLVFVPPRGAAMARRSALRAAASVPSDDASIRRNDAAATGPAARPSPELTAEEAIRIQLDALVNNDVPQQDHGLEVMYLFANADGNFDGKLSCYFGSSADLYHFGHFALKFKTRFPELLKMKSYKILEACNDKVVVRVMQGEGEGNRSKWLFRMSKVQRGKSFYWLTDSLQRLSDTQ